MLLVLFMALSKLKIAGDRCCVCMFVLIFVWRRSGREAAGSFSFFGELWVTEILATPRGDGTQNNFGAPARPPAAQN